MDFYDAHVHLLWEGDLERALEPWGLMKEDGLKGMALIIMAHHLGDRTRCLKLIPPAYHGFFDSSFFSRPPSVENCIPPAPAGIEFFPYLDSRYIQEPQADLKKFHDAGIEGLKVLFVPEEDRDNGMVGWERLLGRSLEESEDLTSRLVEQAAGYGWPVIFHADLRRYGDYVEDLLGAFPRTNFILPHFGFSRKAVTGLLERRENVYTDFSSLLPFMRKNPKAYLDFINDFPERVLFGSDAVVNWPELTRDYLEFIREKIPREETLSRVLSGNYLKIHGRTDPS